MDALRALSEWPAAELLRRSTVAYPLANAAHIASVGLLLGAVVALDLRLLGAFRAHPIAHLAPPLVRVASCGLLAAAATGLLLLFCTRPLAYAQNPAFLAKLGLVGLGLLDALALRLDRRWREVVAGRAAVPGLHQGRGARLPAALAGRGRRRALDRLPPVAPGGARTPPAWTAGRRGA